jgi:hypothetical protein
LEICVGELLSYKPVTLISNTPLPFKFLICCSPQANREGAEVQDLSLCFFNHWSDGNFPTFGRKELERLLGVLREDVTFGCYLA